jgi:hypothetical protein
MWFSIQILESTDISNPVILMVLVRLTEYGRKDSDDDMLRCLELETFTISECIFISLNFLLKRKACIGNAESAYVGVQQNK